MRGTDGCAGLSLRMPGRNGSGDRDGATGCRPRDKNWPTVSNIDVDEKKSDECRNSKSPTHFRMI